MASDSLDMPDDGEDLGSTDTDGEAFELSPGESVRARVISMRDHQTEYGESGWLVLEFEDGTVQDYFCTSDVKRHYNAGDIERGEIYYLGKEAEVSEVNGNEYHPVRIQKVEDY